MQKETRSVYFDTDLNIEAYNLKGIIQKFPNHFHDYYVIGFVENGQRHLSCKNKSYNVGPGDITIFNPNDNHTCEQIDNKALDYRCLNIQPDIMNKAAFEITGKDHIPYFTENVLFNNELIASLKELHRMIIQEERDFKKEETFFFIMEQLISEYSNEDFLVDVEESNREINTICEYLKSNYSKNISLNDLSALTGISKYHLLRSFTKQKGISPYSYLEAIRINEAKRFLEHGTSPSEAALKTGFTDQSHFTNFFKKFIGITPKQYMKIFIEKDKGDLNEK